jgi:hypothetical protein
MDLSHREREEKEKHTAELAPLYFRNEFGFCWLGSDWHAQKPDEAQDSKAWRVEETNQLSVTAVNSGKERDYEAWEGHGWGESRGDDGWWFCAVGAGSE